MLNDKEIYLQVLVHSEHLKIEIEIICNGEYLGQSIALNKKL